MYIESNSKSNSMFLQAVTENDVMSYIGKLKNKKTLVIYQMSS
ncbi:unnamed protein product [Acanthoscelides obtectus]|uniref:Uncharacterized protein n=1 Tax=Acanthoscelides obtectus TaxID=200917 RepID=A0A9P0PXJ3_ACAOB|nr:unnamed protein product [Acanthoscelides obtectus]CAK1667175.1 hypothetical protein AOBTE_LOCUS25705 [Acanthoscelides obtectus]